MASRLETTGHTASLVSSSDTLCVKMRGDEVMTYQPKMVLSSFALWAEYAMRPTCMPSAYAHAPGLESGTLPRKGSSVCTLAYTDSNTFVTSVEVL